mmetsp:Transcript_127324/g.219739  ORF Transcript_127324/g.219739 Transcript_127324/m.219739 type:complete len:88 (-) Transcript_127324:54-317(-)
MAAVRNAAARKAQQSRGEGQPQEAPLRLGSGEEAGDVGLGWLMRSGGQYPRLPAPSQRPAGLPQAAQMAPQRRSRSQGWAGGARRNF